MTNGTRAATMARTGMSPSPDAPRKISARNGDVGALVALVAVLAGEGEPQGAVAVAEDGDER
jgi:hypothetical protein